MTGLPRFGSSNGIRISPHQIPVSSEHPPPYERHARASDINTLHNVVEELIELTVISNAEIIANSQFTIYNTLKNMLKAV